MKWLQLRCATNLARIWRDTGRRKKAQDLLSPVYDCFIEGFDTADFKDARAVPRSASIQLSMPTML